MADQAGLPPVAILAGGLATRLGTLTARCPKAMLPVAGEPFIGHQLRWLAAEGVRRVVLCTGHLGETIEAHVGDGTTFGLDVRYSHDGPTLLGTGGALRRALPLLDASFLVLYGDSLTPIPLAPVLRTHATAACPAVMVILRNEGRWDRSNVLASAGRLALYDKRQPTPEMAHIDYGVGVMTRGVLEAYPLNVPLDLSDVYHALSRAGQLAGHEVDQRFYEIGSLTGLAETEAYLAGKGTR